MFLSQMSRTSPIMGGIDHHDWLAGRYVTSLLGKKWYWPLFNCVLDTMIVYLCIQCILVDSMGYPQVPQSRRAA